MINFYLNLSLPLIVILYTAYVFIPKSSITFSCPVLYYLPLSVFPLTHSSILFFFLTQRYSMQTFNPFFSLFPKRILILISVYLPYKESPQYFFHLSIRFSKLFTNTTFQGLQFWILVNGQCFDSINIFFLNAILVSNL